jgi:putative ABC transport system permease protein
VLARVRKLQGVTVATYGMSPAEALTTRIVAEGRESESHATSIYVVNPNYFQVAGIALKAGRCFGPEDIQGAAPVVMIDANLAEFLWPGQQAIGRRLRSGPNAAWATVVGIVSPIKTGDFVTRARDFQMYRPVAQSAVSFRGMLARTDTDTDAGPIISAMRSTMTEVEASLDRVKPELVSDAYVDQLGSPRFYLALMTFLGIAGLTTAVVGIYASTNYAVRQRTREIGIRIALGSSRHRATLEMVRGTLRPSLAGTAAGMLLAFWLARQLSTLLYQVDPRDPRMFAGAGVLLIIATILGALVPAARAGQVDPATTLRAE